MFEIFKKKGDYVAVHKDSCGHLRKHGGPKNPRMYTYTKFSTLTQALDYAHRTGLLVKQCRCC